MMVVVPNAQTLKICINHLEVLLTSAKNPITWMLPYLTDVFLFYTMQRF